LISEFGYVESNRSWQDWRSAAESAAGAIVDIFDARGAVFEVALRRTGNAVVAVIEFTVDDHAEAFFEDSVPTAVVRAALRRRAMPSSLSCFKMVRVCCGNITSPSVVNG
jgi:hypothetical protein